MLLKKRVFILSIFVIFLIVAISFASAINSNSEKNLRPKESPLYKIRIRKVIKEKMGEILRRFVGERVFFLPFQWLRKIINTEINPPSSDTWPSCDPEKC